MLNRLVGKIAGPIARKLALARIRDAAEGRLGPEWKARYWALAGVKRWIGFAAFVVAVGLEAAGQIEAALYVGVASAFLVSAGLVDKGWRTEIPQAVRDSRAYQIAAQFSGELAAVLATGAYFIASGDCGPFDCGMAARVLVVVSALLVQLGLVDAAWRAVPPIVRREDGQFVIRIPDATLGSFDMVAPTRAQLEDAWRQTRG